jgi:hypothetical protein
MIFLSNNRSYYFFNFTLILIKMKILDDVKLDFTDVLILPKRSEYYSRSEVSLERTFKNVSIYVGLFLNYQFHF